MRELFDQLRDLPEPPLVPATRVLAHARRSARRRTVAGTVGAAAAILVVSSAAAVVVHRPPVAPVAAPSTAAPSPDAPATPAAPDEQAVQAHAATLTTLMRAAVPAGYTAEPIIRGTGPITYIRRLRMPGGSFRAISLVRVGLDGAAGTLEVLTGTDVSPWGTDPCATERDLGIEGVTVRDCTVTSTGGVQVRVVTGHDTGSGEVVAVTRRLRGGYLVVAVSQGLRGYLVTRVDSTTDWEVAVEPGDAPALPALPISTARLVALAVDPATLP